MTKLFSGYDWKKTLTKGGSIFVYSGVASAVVFVLQALAEMPANGLWELLIVGFATGGFAALSNYLKNKDK